MRRVWMIMVMATLANAAQAAGEDLVNCRWPNGEAIDAKVCDLLRRLDAKDRAAAEVERQRQEQSRQRQEAEAAEAAVRKAQDDAIYQAAAEREAQARAQRVAAAAKLEAQAAAEEREARRQDRVRRKVCGSDYANPQVGMHMARVRNCVGDVVLLGQVNRAEGVVSTYRSGRLLLTVHKDRIVAWSRH